MKRIILSVMAAVALLATSCDKPTDTEALTKKDCSLENSMKLQTGNWWVYEKYDIDENGMKIPGRDCIDSVVVEGTVMQLGKTAYEVEHHITYDGGITYENETQWMAIEEGHLYNLEYILYSPESLITQRWIEIAECGSDAWTALDTTTTGVGIVPGENMDTTATQKFHFLTAGHTGTQSVIPVGGQSVTAQEYILDHFIKFSIIEPQDITFNWGGREAKQVGQVRYFFAENIGIVRIEKKPTVYIKISPDGTEAERIVHANGSRSTLLRWSVK